MTQLLTARQVCERLGCHRRTLEVWAKTGAFPAPVLVGNRSLRWRQSDIEDYLNQRQRSAAIN
jgi:excisionase family DNA binding protein